MVHSLMNEKSSLNVAAILKAEQEYHEAKAQANKRRFLAAGGVMASKAGKTGDVVSVGGGSTVTQPAAVGGVSGGGSSGRKSQLLLDIEKIRRDIQEILSDDIDSIDKMPAALDKLSSLDSEVKELRQEVQKFSKEVVSALAKLEAKLNSLNFGPAVQGNQSAGGDAAKSSAPSAPAKSEAKKDNKDDDDIDLFGSDEDEDEDEKEKLRLERVAAAADKKSKKPAVIAKSMITIDVKPWDDETDVKEMENKVRSIEADGLVWGTSKFVEIAYGIKKLRITCVVEDDKIGTDWLEEKITEFEDLVQSIDVESFNKI